jgi:hypothetical protein
MNELSAEVSTTIRAPLAMTFELLVPIDLTRILCGYGPLPAVRAVEDQIGAWDTPGQTRTIRLADGSSLREELVAVERPHHFAYHVGELTGPLRLLTRGLRGAWWFEEISAPGTGAPLTAARWRYVFEQRSLLTRPLASLVVRLLWQPYMAQALERAREYAEEAT